MFKNNKFLLSLAMLCLTLFATPAHAKGFMLFNTGEELFEVASFPQDIVKDNTDMQDLKVGYKCSHFGLFWADAWTWDCNMVGIENTTTYMTLPSELVSKLSTDPQYNFGHAQRSFWNHYGILLALGGLLLLMFLGGSSKKEENAG